jgi:hypothetical protein
MRLILTAHFSRFVRKNEISAPDLWGVVRSIQSGLIDADLGGGVLKLRFARKGEGKSGGYRFLIAYQRSRRTAFLVGYAKSEQANISQQELTALKKLSADILGLSDARLTELVRSGKLFEVMEDA